MKKIFILLLICTKLLSSTFDDAWYTSQNIYKNLLQKFKKDQELYDQSFVQNLWIVEQKIRADLILGNPNYNCFNDTFFGKFMLRTSIHPYESKFINNFL